ncbi:MAG: NAD(P)H-hydrate dehydratase [Ruminococcus sp.]
MEQTEWAESECSGFEKRGGSEKPVVIDADGLNLLAEHPEWQEFINENAILTPHMGEMSRLTGSSISHLKRIRQPRPLNLQTEAGAPVC